MRTVEIQLYFSFTAQLCAAMRVLKEVAQLGLIPGMRSVSLWVKLQNTKQLCSVGLLPTQRFLHTGLSWEEKCFAAVLSCICVAEVGMCCFPTRLVLL